MVEGLGQCRGHRDRIETGYWKELHRDRSGSNTGGTGKDQRGIRNIHRIADVPADDDSSTGDGLDRPSVLTDQRIDNGCDLGGELIRSVGGQERDDIRGENRLRVACEVEFEPDRLTAGRGVGEGLAIGHTTGWNRQDESAIEFQGTSATACKRNGEAIAIDTIGRVVWGDDTNRRLVDQSQFVDAVLAPETSQRCQADRAAVEAIAKDVVDAGAEHSTVLGQNDVVLGDCQRIRTGSLAFIDEDFEVVDIAGLELHIRIRTVQVDPCGVIV